MYTKEVDDKVDVDNTLGFWGTLLKELNIINQIEVPFIFGIIGALCFLLITVFKQGPRILNFGTWYSTILMFLSFLALGGVAGIAAVNILNSNATTTEALVLGIIAGLSGMVYLERISLMDNIGQENVFLNAIKKEQDFSQELKEDLNARKGKDDAINEWFDYRELFFEEQNPEASEEEIGAFFDKLELEAKQIWGGIDDE